MSKSFSSNILILLFANLLVKPLYVLGIDAQVQNVLGDKVYGQFFALFNFCFLLQIVLDLGIHNYNSTFLSKNREAIADHFPYILGSKVLLTFVYSVTVFTMAIIIGYPKDYYPMLGGVVAIFSLLSLFLFLRSHFSAIGHYRKDVWLSVLDKVLMILILGYLIYVRELDTIYQFIISQIIALVIAIIFVLYFLKNQFDIRIEFSITKTKSLLRKSLPFALVVFMMTLYTRIDAVMLERMIEDEGMAAGIYARGFRLLDAASILGFLFATLLLPMYAHHIKDKKVLHDLSQKSGSLLITISTIISLTCWFYGEDILNLIYDNNGDTHYAVFRLLMVSFWFMSMAYIYGTMVSASGQLTRFNYLLLGGIILNWTLNWIMIPRYGAIGAAWTTLLTQAVVFLGQVWLTKSMFSISVFPRSIMHTGAFVLLSLMTFYFLVDYWDIWWPIVLAVSAILCLGYSILLGFLRLNDLAKS